MIFAEEHKGETDLTRLLLKYVDQLNIWYKQLVTNMALYHEWGLFHSTIIKPETLPQSGLILLPASFIICEAVFLLTMTSTKVVVELKILLTAIFYGAQCIFFLKVLLYMYFLIMTKSNKYIKS